MIFIHDFVVAPSKQQALSRTCKPLFLYNKLATVIMMINLSPSFLDFPRHPPELKSHQDCDSHRLHCCLYTIGTESLFAKIWHTPVCTKPASKISATEPFMSPIINRTEATQNSQKFPIAEPHVITFSKSNLIYEDWEDNVVQEQAKVNAAIQIVIISQHHRAPLPPIEDKNDYEWLSVDTLEEPVCVNFERDTFFFADSDAFQVFFDCVDNPLEYPVLYRVQGLANIFEKVRHIAIGGLALPPVVFETLGHFENLQSIRLDSRIITPSDLTTREKTEREFATWCQARLRERGFAVPLIEWAFDLGYWFTRRSNLGEKGWTTQAGAGKIFERGEACPAATTFMAQCLERGNRRFIPGRKERYEQMPWIPSGAYRG